MGKPIVTLTKPLVRQHGVTRCGIRMPMPRYRLIGTLAVVALMAACSADRRPTTTAPSPTSSATPEQVTLSGRVLEVGQGPVSNVLVHLNLFGTVTALTDAAGAYTLSVPVGSLVNASFEREGYNREDYQFGLAGLAPTTRDVKIQRLLRDGRGYKPEIGLRNDALYTEIPNHHLEDCAARLDPVKALRFASPRAAGFRP